MFSEGKKKQIQRKKIDSLLRGNDRRGTGMTEKETDRKTVSGIEYRVSS